MSSYNNQKHQKAIFALILLFAFSTLGFLYQLKKNSIKLKELEKSHSEVNELINQKSFLLELIEADNFIVMDGNYSKALEKYKQLPETEIFSELISERIIKLDEIFSKKNSDKSTENTYDFMIEKYHNQLKELEQKTDSIILYKELEIQRLNEKISSLSNELISKNSDQKKNQNVQVISFKNSNGKTIHYLGEISNNKANGGGVGIWNTGSIYRGEWKNNMRQGKGTYEWNDGQKYIGEYNEDKREGEGTYYWPSGERYEGEWKDDKRNGYGILYDIDGNIRFEGGWKDDKPVTK